jgi:hypothetical protein
MGSLANTIHVRKVLVILNPSIFLSEKKKNTISEHLEDLGSEAYQPSFEDSTLAENHLSKSKKKKKKGKGYE